MGKTQSQSNERFHGLIESDLSDGALSPRKRKLCRPCHERQKGKPLESNSKFSLTPEHNYSQNESTWQSSLEEAIYSVKF